ncbi:MAG: response regulator transcription factor [Nocardioidaceae bacterium]|nr:response regulator transcription factor [Nocardioidaceae bacterium]NUS51294.1 response regulator transcription factor [Nocardioidaceae bacterium]
MTTYVCDPHPMFADALALALRSRGHTEVVVVAPQDLVRRAAGDPAGPPVVVLDEPALVDDLRVARPDVTVMLLTEQQCADARAAFDDGSVTGLVAKTCDVRSVESALRRVCRGERVLEGYRACEQPVRPDRSPDDLTPREHEVLTLLADGESTSAMAARLGVSVNTVRTHLRTLFQKLGVNTRAKAARIAIDRGLLGAA